MINVKLCEIPIQLNTSLPTIHAEWEEIFILHHCKDDITQAAIHISAHSLDQAPTTDQNRPTSNFKSPSGNYSLALTPDGRSKLTLASGAIICLPNLNQPFNLQKPISAEMFITPRSIDMGQVEDVTFTLLAPILRRLHIYIVHAFAAAHPTKPIAALIIGRSGQGKTTTGLNLIKEGWRFLSNDAIFLSKNNQGEIIAWLSPGKINLHPKSIALLNKPAFLPSHLQQGPDGKYHFPAKTLVSKQLPYATAQFQIFPQIVNQQGACQFERLPAAIALTQTIEQSVDHWDTQTLNDHFAFLQQLTDQTDNFQSKNTTDLTGYGEKLLAFSKL